MLPKRNIPEHKVSEAYVARLRLVRDRLERSEPNTGACARAIYDTRRLMGETEMEALSLVRPTRKLEVCMREALSLHLRSGPHPL